MAKRKCSGCKKGVLYVRDFDNKPVVLDQAKTVFVLQKDLMKAQVAMPAHQYYVAHQCKCPKEGKDGKPIDSHKRRAG